uniref:Uncharacterized protein n=1 Tax=Cucumis melo TaxID=3656 RepID=A0A9I9E9Q3_CUCME
MFMCVWKLVTTGIYRSSKCSSPTKHVPCFSTAIRTLVGPTHDPEKLNFSLSYFTLFTFLLYQTPRKKGFLSTFLPFLPFSISSLSSLSSLISRPHHHNHLSYPARAGCGAKFPVQWHQRARKQKVSELLSRVSLVRQQAKQEDECGVLRRRLVSVALGGGGPYLAVEIVILFFGVPFEICENYKLEFERDGFCISTFPASKALEL